MLGGEQPKTQRRRSQGVHRSTENAPAPEAHTAEASHPQRVNRGYMLRADLIKALKLLAVQEDRNLYEVMEEALEEYLARHRES